MSTNRHLLAIGVLETPTALMALQGHDHAASAAKGEGKRREVKWKRTVEGRGQVRLEKKKEDVGAGGWTGWVWDVTYSQQTHIVATRRRLICL